MRCGLLGRKLGHSYSPQIHAMLGDYSYQLYEKEPQALASFLRAGEFTGLNVTIPYKKSVLAYCSALSETAQTLGNVNTLLLRPDGTLYGDNTDAFGFQFLLERSGICVQKKRALVFGSGGASATVQYVLRKLGAASVTVISRSGEDNYENLQRHADAQILVNATPLGMYPGNGETPADLLRFPACEGVLDLIYNPARTALLLQAQALGIPCQNGLVMLVAQAKRSAELFTGEKIPDDVILKIADKVERAQKNIVLIGMPGCGKSTVAAALARALGRECCDSDLLLVQQMGQTIEAAFAQRGEAAFRDLETQLLRQLGKRSGIVLSTGGGSVLRAENRALLQQNGTVIWLTRDLRKLPRAGRPLSMRHDLSALYTQRAPLYAGAAEFTVSNDGTVENTVRRILEVLA